jgi:hypothetical protein
MSDLHANIILLRLFYMNLPISAIAFVLVAVFMNVKRPAGTFREKFAKIDWMYALFPSSLSLTRSLTLFWFVNSGNGIFVAATSALIYGLTVAGSKYSWTSYRSLVPLIVGIVGTVFAVYVEKRWVKYPTIPFNIFTNRSSAMGYLQVFIHAVAILCVVYYLRE